MNTSLKLLNPFAFILERKEKRLYDVNTKPVYENGEYKTYRFDGKWFVTCRGNIIVTETISIPTTLIEHLVKGEEPTDSVTNHHYHRCLDIWPYALKCADMIGFTIEGLN